MPCTAVSAVSFPPIQSKEASEPTFRRGTASFSASHSSDTHPSMSNEKADIQKLYEKIANPGSENIGLTNVNSRLIMRYGEGAGLKILSKKGMGTCISFRISEEIVCSVPHKRRQCVPVPQISSHISGHAE